MPLSYPKHSKDDLTLDFTNHISSHDGRRTFATLAYLNSDLQIRDIMQFFGHKKESTFMKYVQVQRPIDTHKIIDIFGGSLKKVS